MEDEELQSSGMCGKVYIQLCEEVSTSDIKDIFNTFEGE